MSVTDIEAGKFNKLSLIACYKQLKNEEHKLLGKLNVSCQIHDADNKLYDFDQLDRKIEISVDYDKNKEKFTIPDEKLISNEA
jgi:hypothetical protein